MDKKKKPIRKRKTEKKLTANQKLVNYLVTQIKDGNRLIWRTPYINVRGRNYVTQRVYSGINYIFTTFNGSGDYITMNQLKDYNEKNNTHFYIKKGSKGMPLNVFNKKEKNITEAEKNRLVQAGKAYNIRADGENGFIKTDVYAGIVYVYDIEDIEDIKTKEKLPRKKGSARRSVDIKNNAIIENFIKQYTEKSGVVLHDNKKSIMGTVASYNIKADKLNIPSKTNFKSDTEYYSTVLHEIIHSTGHKSRLNRENINLSVENGVDMRSREYSNEEVVAEFGSALLAQELGMSSEDERKNSSSYINGFCNWLVNNPDDLIKCVREAEEAVKYALDLVGLTYKNELEKNVNDDKESEKMSEEDFKEKIKKDLNENTTLKEPTIKYSAKNFQKIFYTELEKTVNLNSDKFNKRYDRIKGNKIIEKTLINIGIVPINQKGLNNPKGMFKVTNSSGNSIADSTLYFNTSFAYFVKGDTIKLIYNLDTNNSTLKEALQITTDLGFPNMKMFLSLVNLRTKKLTEEDSVKLYVKLFSSSITAKQKNLLKENKIDDFIKEIVK